MKAEGWTFPETAVGADGKERTTKYKKSTPANAEVETPSSPPSFCANGCGTPIWEANKADPNYTYVEEGGKWFCSPECAEAYKEKSVFKNLKTETEPEETPEPWEPDSLPSEKISLFFLKSKGGGIFLKKKGDIITIVKHLQYKQGD